MSILLLVMVTLNRRIEGLPSPNYSSMTRELRRIVPRFGSKMREGAGFFAELLDLV
jgi:hypothetical protein